MKKKFLSGIIAAGLVLNMPYIYAEDKLSLQAQGKVEAVEESIAPTPVGTPMLEVTPTPEGTPVVEETPTPEGTPVIEATPMPEGGNEEVVPPTEETTEGEELPVEEDLLNKVILTLNSTTALVDGNAVELLSPPTVIENKTLLPLRFVANEVVGAQVDWNGETQTITITKGEKIVVVKVGINTAMIDDMPVELDVPPIIKEGVTLLPLRFISEAFGIEVNFDNATKQITLIKDTAPLPEPIPNEPPVASFYFPQTYIAGQEVQAIDTSTDLDGDLIVDKLWSVVGEKTVTNKVLSNMFKTPRAGTYLIGLKVQDAKGDWSEWTYESITIEPNKAPVITGLTSNKSSYAQGENIEFYYTYDNETWETVKEGKWTYRSINESANRATLGKPGVLFAEGKYVVTLYLDDAYGNRSEPVETYVTVTNDIKMSELTYRFTQDKVGAWIDNFQNTNYLLYKQAQVDAMTYDEGTLIMSDSPEFVTGQGTLYRDKINGKGRLLIHHINNISDAMTNGEKQRLVTIVRNETEAPITVTLKNKSIKGPSTDILRVGQLTLVEYLEGKVPTETIVLAPGESKFIYDKNWIKDQCVSGHVDVETDGEATFIFANLSSSQTIDDLEVLPYFAADGVHYSGTYNKTGIRYNLTLKGNEPEKLTLGVANSGEWVTGYDERTPNDLAMNMGNFGVSYYITVTAEEDMGVILNSRGGMYKGAIKWNDKVYNMPGDGEFSGTVAKAVTMGVIKKGETVTIEYLLPNGSAAPTLIGFIPKSYW